MTAPVALSRNDGAFDVSLDQLRQRSSYKWRAFAPDVLPAFVAEMDFTLAPPIVDALSNAVSNGDAGYAWPDPELGHAFSGFAKRRYAWDVDPEDLILLPEVMVAVTELLRIALQPDDGVVINTPVYPPFFEHITQAGCRVVEAPLAHAARSYELDFDALVQAFESGARAYLLCNPHNPTGRVFSRTELERIAEIAERYDALVLADEIHAPLVLPGAQHTPFLALGSAAASRTITFVSASKGWNIPGLKCAQAVVASDAMRDLTRPLATNQSFIVRAGNLGIVASIAAYRDSVGWLDDLVRVLDGQRAMFAGLLRDALPEARHQPPEAGYLAWVDCRHLGIAGEPADVFRERGRVALGAGLDFGAPGKGFVRVTTATSAAILTEIVDRMRSCAPDAVRESEG